MGTPRPSMTDRLTRFAVGARRRRFYYQTANRIRRALRLDRRWREGRTVFPSGEATASSPWVYHDERWPTIQNRRDYRALLATGVQPPEHETPQALGHEVRIAPDGGVSVRTAAASPDRWVWLSAESGSPEWRDYVYRLRVRRLSRFRELQIGFRCRDFYNRYRYRFEADYVFFDIVVGGVFINALSVAPLPMEVGRWYDISVVVVGDRFRCYVDDRLLMDDFDPFGHFPTGSVALIMWEDDGLTGIEADVEQPRVKIIAAS